MNQKLLDVHDVKKSFRIDRHFTKQVLKGINFYLQPEEILTIMGPSGGGKSTFLKILAAIIGYDEGSIIFQGQDIKNHKDAYTSHISFIFQDYKLIPHLTTFENISLALRLRGIDNWQYKAQEALDFCLIGELKNSYPWQLSGGESQRVGIARAIAVSPSIIFADEPTGNLDSKTAKEILEVFTQIKQQFHTSFVLVTHDHKICDYADRQYFLQDGKLTTEDPYAE